jgi:hypothetical protein
MNFKTSLEILELAINVNIFDSKYYSQMSNFCKQYCNKAIIFLTKYCFYFSKSAEITMNQDFQFTWWRKKYLFIAISLYLLIVILLVKIARLTRALGRWKRWKKMCGLLNLNRPEKHNKIEAIFFHSFTLVYNPTYMKSNFILPSFEPILSQKSDLYFLLLTFL